ncbi:hypothetical protein FH972_024608 [Carpinus fangiana]|uniref:Uncharacterized protein n=1 Tax=Carpinus fangiana TaxID=176857 RepID=A0A5N6L112_9ROSI|nr:hypothetical protein FH972_024608 [Carpinus fangiana]
MAILGLIIAFFAAQSPVLGVPPSMACKHNHKVARAPQGLVTIDDGKIFVHFIRNSLNILLKWKWLAAWLKESGRRRWLTVGQDLKHEDHTRATDGDREDAEQEDHADTKLRFKLHVELPHADEWQAQDAKINEEIRHTHDRQQDKSVGAFPLQVSQRTPIRLLGLSADKSDETPVCDGEDLATEDAAEEEEEDQANEANGPIGQQQESYFELSVTDSMAGAGGLCEPIVLVAAPIMRTMPHAVVRTRAGMVSQSSQEYPACFIRLERKRPAMAKRARMGKRMPSTYVLVTFTNCMATSVHRQTMRRRAQAGDKTKGTWRPEDDTASFGYTWGGESSNLTRGTSATRRRIVGHGEVTATLWTPTARAAAVPHYMPGTLAHHGAPRARPRARAGRDRLPIASPKHTATA